jgi:hypothetical protein
MNEKIKYIAAIMVFGSLWGFSECIIGPQISNSVIPTGVIMTGFFAMILLTLSRLFFKTKGMQFGIGLVAGSLRYFNPFGGCHICASIAIVAEAFIFELIFDYLSTVDLNKIKTLTAKVGLGVFSAYVIYVGGTIITQILTPLSFGSFYFENLLLAIPSILADGLLVALIGAAVAPITIELSRIDLKIPDRLYYPTTTGITAFCWIIVISNFLLL